MSKKKATAPKVPPTLLYIIVGFCVPYMKAQISRSKLNRQAEALHRQAKAGKDVANKQRILNQKSKENWLENLSNRVAGTKNIGIFLDKDSALAAIAKHPQGIQEAGYYSHLVIERRYTGLEGYDIERGNEVWFTLSKDGNKYVKIRKPACFIGVCGFSH